MVRVGPQRPLWRWLALLLLVSSSVALAFAPSQAQPPCLGTEDGHCLSAPAAAEPREPRAAEARLHGRSAPTAPAALVRRRDSVAPARMAAALRQGGYDASRGLAVQGWWRVSPRPEETMDELLRRLRALPEVAYAEEDRPVQAAYLPDDPLVASQWALPAVSAWPAWDRTWGDGDVWIAVVDSGVDDLHPDTPSDLWWGWDFANDDGDPWDDNGHGTHVAGIAAAATDNAAGVAGLCPGCGVLAVKVLAGDGRGWNAHVAEGIAYAAFWGHDQGKRTIINVSLGGAYSLAVADAVAYAQGLGALVVSASGNDGPVAPDYPAALSGVLGVTATDSHDAPAGFSQYGDLAAPGVDILSTVPAWYVVPSAPPYQTWSGTSMAAPLVAGAAGLIWSLAPSLSASAVGERLLTGVDVPAGWNSAYGAGRLNVARALPLDPTPTPTFTPWPLPTSTPTPAPTSTPTPTPGAGRTTQPTVPAPTATPVISLPDSPTPAPHRLALPMLVASR